MSGGIKESNPADNSSEAQQASDLPRYQPRRPAEDFSIEKIYAERIHDHAKKLAKEAIRIMEETEQIEFDVRFAEMLDQQEQAEKNQPPSRA